MLRRVRRRGSKKGLSRRHLESRSTPFREYDPLGVCPTQIARISKFKRCFRGFGVQVLRWKRHMLLHEKLVWIGHPWTCVYPDVCLGIGDVSGKVPLPGIRSLVDTQRFCLATLQIPWEEEEAGGVSTRYLAPGGGLYQIQCHSVNTHRGKHRLGGAQSGELLTNRCLGQLKSHLQIAICDLNLSSNRC